MSTIQSLRHLTLKKISSTSQDDSALQKSFFSQAEDDPFVAAQEDFESADKVRPTLSRRQTMAPSTTRAGKSNRITVHNPLKTNLTSELRIAIHEIIEEIEMSKEDVTAQAKEHISDNDLILTYHTSTTLTSFFIEAKESANFEVIVCETAPKFTGH